MVVIGPPRAHHGGRDLYHAYLTDGHRLVQVLYVGETELVCEDVCAPADRPAPIVNVRRSDIGPVWRRVTPPKEEESQ